MLATSLLAGVVLTIVFGALGIWRERAAWSRQIEEDPNDDGWMVSTGRDPLGLCLYEYSFYGAWDGPGESLSRRTRASRWESLRARDPVEVFLIETGVPWRAFRGAQYTSQAAARARIKEEILLGATEWRIGRSTYMVPYAIRPIAFAADAIFFMVVLVAIRMGVRGVVHARRRRVGRCIECGYDLGLVVKGDETAIADVCPECGSAIVATTKV